MCHLDRPVFETKDIIFDQKPVTLSVCERRSGRWNSRLSALLYPNSHLHLVCVSIVNFSLDDYDSLEKYHIYNIKHFSPGTPIILVGTKLDLIDDEETLDRLRVVRRAPLSHEQGERLALELGLTGYLECSAATNEGVQELLKQSLDIATKNEDKQGGVNIGGWRRYFPLWGRHTHDETCGNDDIWDEEEAW
ncbi:P-loop containing nucleoside triphosphate hydrolase protein [Flagelloscypha sp. PMI_526]|nr:P-loop containing nucleoside triphosphate hydrolase protein [Flagelloscypha sp. PMI_526]